MKVSGDWLQHEGTQALCAALEAGGFQALLVGGCVRNALLGEPVRDIDIATDARPEIVTKLAKNAGFRAVPTGIDHGTVTVIAGGRPHEVTTFRRDIETDGRHAVVAFGTSLTEDAARRDFTMNALYADRQGAVVDPLGGLPDLLARRLRFVGEPTARIQEDHLRILRFFRFHAWYGDPAQGPDAEGLAACAALAEGVERLSRERIGAEMRKLLSAPDPAPAVASMAATGVLARVLPGADARALAPLVHLEGAEPIRWLRRLAVIGGHDLVENLRLSRAETTRIGHLRDEIGTTTRPVELGWRHGAESAADVVLARAALFGTPLPPDWQAEVARGAGSRFPVRASDLPGMQGPALGRRLKMLQERWLASDLRLSKAALLQGSDD
jgi:poly(A) polymerase